MSKTDTDRAKGCAEVENLDAAGSVLLICEHASPYIPEHFQQLGLAEAHLESHAAWDPGALAVARRMSKRLDATLISAGVSRLVQDCNRPPEAADAMPVRSEVVEIPGNVDLSEAERAERTAAYYTPFHDLIATRLSAMDAPVIITVHSFTPVFAGVAREVEIGILHDTDARLADVLLDHLPQHTTLNVQRNVPYGPEDGVTHTLKKHALEAGYLNVMLEVRNDLIASPATQLAIGDMLSCTILSALPALQSEVARCTA